MKSKRNRDTVLKIISVFAAMLIFIAGAGIEGSDATSLSEMAKWLWLAAIGVVWWLVFAWVNTR